MQLRFSREFIALMVQFAQHVARIKSLPLDEALLRYTPLYLNLGLPRDFDPLHPLWQVFVAGITPHQALVDWTYTFYLQQHTAVPADVAERHPAFGCFYYALWSENRVRIHFQNGEPVNHSPLSRTRRPQRLAELTAMFRHLRSVVPPTATVVGGSWLYNIDAYRRLFPPTYLATAHVGANEYQFLALWGQFLDRYGHVKPTIARTFLEGLQQRVTADSLQHCFPYQVLRLESAISPFYAFYGIV
jgi:hypothetical protein